MITSSTEQQQQQQQQLQQQLQIQSMIDEMKQMHMRIERAERKTQMLTDSFVVAGLWRTSSALCGWKKDNNDGDHEQHGGGGNDDEDMLQFEMTND